MKFIVVPLVFTLCATFAALGCAKGGADARQPEVSFVVDGRPASAVIVDATTSALRSLGSSPVLGRDFIAADFVEGAPKVAIISSGLWKEVFAARPDVIGREIRIADQTRIVVGVAPESPAQLSGRKVWIAIRE